MISGMVSIITPVYNAAAFLDRMILSVKAQHYQSWQLVLVDDGSTDGSEAICDRFACEDERIIVIHQSNSGVAMARNRALTVCDGEFISFCDSDDWLEPDYLTTLTDLKNQSDADLCTGNLFIDKSSESKKHLAPITGTIDRAEFVKIYRLWFDIYWMGLWNKIFRTEIIRKRNVRFKEGLRMGEDSLFILDYLESANAVQCSDRPIYHYVQHTGSSLTHGFNPDRLRGCDLVIGKLKQRLINAGAYNAKAEEMMTARRADTLSAYVYTALTSENLSEKQKDSVYRELKVSNAERQILKKSHNLTTKVIGYAPYRVLKIYMQLLSIWHTKGKKT